MTQKIKIILNPYANRWGAKKQYHRIEAALTAVSITPDIVTTKKAGHGIELAFEAVNSGYDVVVAAGGDGTINEVINGLIQASSESPTIPFGILPI